MGTEVAHVEAAGRIAKDPSLQPHLRPRVRTVVLVAVGTIALMVGTFLLGLTFRGGDEAAFENSLRQIYSKAAVELKVEAPVTVQATAVGGTSVQVLAAVPEGSSIAQVSADPLPPGTAVAPGVVVTAISGRPVFALPISAPYYRDLRLYDEGADVLALNAALVALGLDVDGSSDEYGWDTAAAIAQLYSSNGFVALRPEPEADPSNPAAPPAQLPIGGSLPFAEVVALGPASMVVTSTEPKLAIVEEGAVVARLSSSVTSIETRVNALDVQQLVAGQRAKIRIPGSNDELDGTLSTISEFRKAPEDGSAIAGYDVVVAIEGGQSLALVDGDAVSLEFEGSAAESIAVPATALQQEGTETFVWIERGETFEQAPVTVQRISDGWALLVESPDFEVGDTVRIG